MGTDSSERKLIGAMALSRGIGLPAPWLIEEAKAGRLPCLMVGKRLLFNRKAVERALAKRAASVNLPAAGEGVPNG